jgi:hypothetical protein
MMRLRPAHALLLLATAACTERTPSRARAQPSAAPATATAAGPGDEGSLSRHAAALRARLPPGFSMVTAPPFVVVGDGASKRVRGHAENTVEWAVEKLKQDFFTAEPREIIDVWLFQNKKSYDDNTRAIFGINPRSPYGFYSSEHKALIMNIATGGGTLVHEIVHPFVEADFPDAPSWLNEGLGSLFEQCDERDGHIVGLTNWRLPGLQEAVREHRVPSFAALTRTSTNEFYERDPGTNYAQARYLCYYLQERGLLMRFYREFRAEHASDPTGYRILQRVLDERDMTAFQARWEAWVSGLSFP